MPYPHAHGGAKGIVDDVVSLTPAHLEEVLGCFGSNGAEAADEDDVLGFELWEQDGKKIAERVVEEDVEDETYNGHRIAQKPDHKARRIGFFRGSNKQPTVYPERHQLQIML